MNLVKLFNYLGLFMLISFGIFPQLAFATPDFKITNKSSIGLLYDYNEIDLDNPQPVKSDFGDFNFAILRKNKQAEIKRLKANAKYFFMILDADKLDSLETAIDKQTDEHEKDRLRAQRLEHIYLLGFTKDPGSTVHLEVYNDTADTLKVVVKSSTNNIDAKGVHFFRNNQREDFIARFLAP